MSSSDEVESEIIDATPHYATLTSVGEYYEHTSGRKPLPFAISEKIDNSISATSRNSEEQGRKIDLYFLYDEGDTLTNIAIRDNGSGMSHSGLKAYTIFNYSQRSRKKDMEDGRCKEGELPVALEDDEQAHDDPRWSINGNIGHFGVGGQHAAFYIGRMEHIMTKTRLEDDRKVPLPVLDLVMSEQQMDQKWQKGENPYDLNRKGRKERDTSCLCADTEAHPFLRELVESEPQGRHASFTLMVSSLINEKVETSLKPDGGDEASYKRKLEPMLEELARIYHYYLHGREGTEDLPPDEQPDDDVADEGDEDQQEMAEEESDSDDPDAENGAGGGSARKRKRNEANGSSSTKKAARKGSDSTVAPSKRREDVRVDIKVHVVKAKGAESKVMYACALVDVPSVEARLFRAQKACFPVYFNLNPKKAGPGASEGRAMSKASLFLYYCPYLLNRETRPHDQFEKDSAANGALFSCYWQGRWVPYAEIGKLGILYNKLHQPEVELLKRVRGTIFFDRHILPSNAKLEFQESVQELLNDVIRCRPFVDWDAMDEGSDQSRQVQNHFALWLRKAHAELDREIRVEDIERVQDKPGGNGQKETVFKKMVFANQDYVPGHKIHIKSTKPHRFGKVVHFVCDNDIRQLDPPVTGTARVVFKRFPEELFGDKLHDEPVNARLLEPVNDKEWKAKVEEIRSKLPAEMVVLKAGPEYTKPWKAGKKNILYRDRPECKANMLFETDLKNGVVTAGYDLPAVSVFVLSRDGTIVWDFPTASGNKAKIKVADKVIMTHEWVHGQFVQLQNPLTLSGGRASDRTQTSVDKNGSFFLDLCGDAFLGAGKYELSYEIPVSDPLILQKTCSKVITVFPGNPKEAQFFTNKQSRVEVVKAPDEYALGAKRKDAKPIIFLITDGCKDPKQRKWTRGNNCLLSDKEIQSLKLEAEIISPPDSGLIVHCYDVSAVKGAASEYQTNILAKLPKETDSAHKENSLSAMLANQRSVEVRCKLKIKFMSDEGKPTEVTTTNELSFIVKAGDPAKLVFDESFSGEIEVQNFERLPQIPLKAVDKFGNVVNFDGKEKEKLEVTEKLVPLNASKEIMNRRLHEHTHTVNVSKDNIISVFHVGGKKISLQEPCVSRSENHQLQITAKYGGKELDCTEVEADVRINPSNLPHSVRPVWDDGEIVHSRENDWHIDAPAGSEVSGVYFKILDEAEEEVSDLRGWSVKWKTRDKLVPFNGVDTVMPTVKCRDKAGDVTELTIVFTGKKSKDGDATAPTLTVSLTLKPYPTQPAMWKLISPNGGDLPDVLKIPCGVPLRKCLAIQLVDEHNNVIDLRRLPQGPGEEESRLAPMLRVFDKNDIKTNDNIKRGDWERFDSSNPSSILPAPDFCLMGPAGKWEIQVDVSTAWKRSEQGKQAKEIKPAKQNVHLVAGEPSALKMVISGLPNENEPPEGQEPPAYSFGGPSQAVKPELTGLPSTCTIKAITVSVVDKVGNALERDAVMRHLKNRSVFLKLENGRIGPDGEETLNKPFTSKSLVFKNVKLQAGKDGDGALMKDGKLVLSSDHAPLKPVRAPLEFAPSSAVVAVCITPDPYPFNFKIGHNLMTVTVKLTTEDGSTVDGNWKEGLSIQCFKMDGQTQVLESADLFKPAESDDVFVASEAEGGAGGDEPARRKNLFHFLPGEGGLKHLGLHKIQVLWEENRHAVASLAGTTKVESNILTFMAVPGPPHWLKDQSKEQIKSRRKTGGIKTVSNKRGQNTILKSLRLQLLDREMNPSPPRGAYLAASLEFVGDKELDDDEQETLEISHDYEFLFINDWEIHDKKMQDRVDMQGDLGRKEHELASVLHQIKQREYAHQQEKASVTYYQNKCTEVIYSFKEVLGNATEVWGVREHDLRHDALGILRKDTIFYLHEPSNCEDLINRLRQTRPGRRCEFPNELRAIANAERNRYPNEVTGFLIELICMNNERHAAAVSKECSGALLTLIVKSHGVAVDIRQRHRHVTSLPTENIVRGYDKFEQRTGGVKRLLFHNAANPRFRWMTDCAVINQIQFQDQRHEELRTTALYNLIGRVCILQTHEEARAKMQECKHFKTSYPDLIIAEDLSRVRSNGVLQGDRRGGGPRLTIGSVDMQTSRIHALGEIRTAMQAHKDKQAQVERDIAASTVQLDKDKRKVEDIRAEISALKNKLDQADEEANSANASPKVPGHDDKKPKGFEEAQLEPPAAAAGGAAGGVGGAQRCTYKFDSNGLADVKELCLRPQHGDKIGAYRLRLQVRTLEDGRDAPLHREFLDKRN